MNLAQKLIKNKNNYTLWAARPSSAQRNELLIPVANKILNSDYLIITKPNGVHDFYLPTNKLNSWYKKFNQQLSSPQAVRKHFSEYSKIKKELLKNSKPKISKNPKKLLTAFKKYQQVLDKYSVYFLTPYAIEAIAEPKLKQKIGDQFEIVANPTMLFGYQKYQIDLAKNKNLDQIIKKYKWLPEYSYQEKLLTKAQIKKEKVDPDILKLPQKIAQNKKQYQKLLSSTTNPKLKALIELVHNYVNIRTERIEIFKQAQTNFRKFYQAVSDLTGLDYKEIIYLSNKELIDLLNGRLIDITNLEQRIKNNYITYKKPSDKKATFIYQTKSIIKAFEATKKQKTIKGIPAQPGKIKGQVQIIKSSADLKNFKTGSILVSRFTNPSYISIMRKAKAIITDEGGVTCHAAIVSRELQKPCLVGTKNATQILKNNDLVELDTTKGIVKIL